jgi:hypothetical protein
MQHCNLWLQCSWWISFDVTDNPWLAHPLISYAAVYFLIPLFRVSFVSDVHVTLSQSPSSACMHRYIHQDLFIKCKNKIVVKMHLCLEGTHVRFKTVLFYDLKTLKKGNWASHHEGVLGEWRYNATHYLTLAVGGGEWSASRPGRFTPREGGHGTHWLGDWVGHRAVLDTVVKRRIPSPFQESNSRTLIVQPIAYSLYKPSYHSFF